MHSSRRVDQDLCTTRPIYFSPISKATLLSLTNNAITHISLSRSPTQYCKTCSGSFRITVRRTVVTLVRIARGLATILRPLLYTNFIYSSPNSFA